MKVDIQKDNEEVCWIPRISLYVIEMTPAAHDDAAARPDEKSNLKNHSREDNDDDGIEVKQVFVSNAAQNCSYLREMSSRSPHTRLLISFDKSDRRGVASLKIPQPF